MQWSKLDAHLQAALAGEPDGDPLRVFIRCRPGARADALDAVQLLSHERPARIGRDFVAASVAPDDLATLSERPWVQSITLSRTLRPIEARDEQRHYTARPNLAPRRPTTHLRAT
jgi:hypothetical protein